MGFAPGNLLVLGEIVEPGVALVQAKLVVMAALLAVAGVWYLLKMGVRSLERRPTARADE